MKTFAMSNHFNPLDGFDRPQDFHAQARILREVGIDGYYYNMGRQVTKDKIKTCTQACSDEGVELAAMYWMANINGNNLDEETGVFHDLLESIPDRCPIELGFVDWSSSIKPSSQKGLEACLHYVDAVMPALKSKSCLLCPYPHFNFLLETVSDSLRMIQLDDRENMKAVASAIHGHIAGEDWIALIAGNLEMFHSVSLCGISKPGNTGGYTIEPLGTGEEVDNRKTVQRLLNIGYTGCIGLQGYSIEMDSRELLSRSSNALKHYLNQ